MAIRMTQRRARLDHSRSFAIVYGGGACRYEQDDKRFDHQGLEILLDVGTDQTADNQFGGETPHASERPRSAAAERMRRTRERTRVGIAAVVSVEVHNAGGGKGPDFWCAFDGAKDR